MSIISNCSRDFQTISREERRNMCSAHANGLSVESIARDHERHARNVSRELTRQGFVTKTNTGTHIRFSENIPNKNNIIIALYESDA